MIFGFQCFYNWYQYLVVTVKVEQFRDDHSVKQELKEYCWIFNFDFRRDEKAKHNKYLIIKSNEDVVIQCLWGWDEFFVLRVKVEQFANGHFQQQYAKGFD